jgi:N-acetyl-anhydromuramyl-L-alanine amidase AmpD
MARKDRIIIAGQDIVVPGAPNGVVTWKEDRFFDFKSYGDDLFFAEARQTYGSRRDPDGNVVGDIEGLKKTVKCAVIHYDVTHNSKGCASVLKKRGLSTHFMIDYDGTIYQGLDVVYQALHAGDSVNVRSVGIDLNNLAQNIAGSRRFTDYKGKSDDDHRREKSRPQLINDVRWQCYGYSDAQYDALIALMKVLQQQLELPIQVPVEESGEIKRDVLDKASAFDGILGHWHISATKFDPGPGFDWQRVLSGILGGANSFPVALRGVKDLVELSRSSNSERERELALVYDNTETSSVGGTYPVGHHMNWHGGIHLYVSDSEEVSAMVDGELVLAHFAKEPTSVGSNNFIVLKHEIELPAKAEEDPKKLKFYSLYMHLAPIDFKVKPGSKEARDLPEWAQLIIGEETEEKPKAAITEDDEGEEDEMSVKRSVALRFGRDSLKSLKRGEVTFLKDINVSAGKVIGNSGQVGREGERESFVQVEIFTDDTWKTAVGTGGHRRHFTFFSEDMDRSLRVRAPGVLSMLTGEYVGYSAGLSEASLSPFEVQDFYSDKGNMTARKLFRRSVTRHVSEWSDQVDWFQALVSLEGEDPPDGWAKIRNRLQRVMGKRGPLRAQSAFAEVLNQTVPFIWLTEEVAEHLGLKQKPWKGVLYHFHPIHFLLWLTFYVGRKERVISDGVSRKERKRRRRAYLEERKSGAGGDADHGDDDYLSILELEERESADEVLEDLKELDIPGTWDEQNSDE